MSLPTLRGALPRLAAPRRALAAPRCRYVSSDMPAPTTPMSPLLTLMAKKKRDPAAATAAPIAFAQIPMENDFLGSSRLMGDMAAAQEDEYHLHVYATKHNTHITFTRPNKDPVVSLSAINHSDSRGKLSNTARVRALSNSLLCARFLHS